MFLNTETKKHYNLSKVNCSKLIETKKALLTLTKTFLFICWSKKSISTMRNQKTFPINFKKNCLNYCHMI